MPGRTVATAAKTVSFKVLRSPRNKPKRVYAVQNKVRSTRSKKEYGSDMKSQP